MPRRPRITVAEAPVHIINAEATAAPASVPTRSMRFIARICGRWRPSSNARCTPKSHDPAQGEQRR